MATYLNRPNLSVVFKQDRRPCGFIFCDESGSRVWVGPPSLASARALECVFFRTRQERDPLLIVTWECVHKPTVPDLLGFYG